jgi:N-acetyl-anhydromuramyl-L-alanine amidase AmpD
MYRQPRARVAMLFILVLALWPSVCLADQGYLVRRGDTLYDISRKYGISLSELAERNGLSKNAHVYAGQRLTIPSGNTTAKPAGSVSVQRAIAEAPVRAGRWKYIVIHHSGIHTGSVQGMDRYHREQRHMENGLAYHFVIGNGDGMRDGQIVAGRRWIEQLDGGHLASASQNQYAIGICLVGNFDRRTPTPKQMQSLRTLTKALMERCRLTVSAVKTHREINVIGTRCPGARFNAAAFRNSL